MTVAEKICASCGRRIEWRAKWERDWDQVRFCSAACRRRGVTAEDRRLEEVTLALLARHLWLKQSAVSLQTSIRLSPPQRP